MLPPELPSRAPPTSSPAPPGPSRTHRGRIEASAPAAIPSRGTPSRGRILETTAPVERLVPSSSATGSGYSPTRHSPSVSRKEAKAKRKEDAKKKSEEKHDAELARKLQVRTVECRLVLINPYPVR
eukprot:COSAG01_NODE_9786_length_2343_cov_9.324866_4_plen_126_part_00